MVGQEGLKMLLNGFANISLGLLDSFPVTEATQQRRAAGEIPDIFYFFFGDDFEAIDKSSEPLFRVRSIS